MRRHQELFDQEMQLQDQDMLAQLFEDFQIYLQQSEKMEMRQLEKERAKQKRLAGKSCTVDVVSPIPDKTLDEKLDQLRKWIWNLDHRSIYEHAAADRCPHSCDWFLGRSEYLSWRDAPFASTSVPQPNKSQGEHRPDFLSFQGRVPWLLRMILINKSPAKPGFGKTVLSTAIIEDLEKRPAPPGEGDTLVPVVAFFHFSECFRVGGKSSMDAFRALVAQLIRAHRSQDSVMDALFILFDKYSGAQEHASQDQVIAVLKLLVQQWPTVFIIDGIDECVDEARLLSNLWTNLHNIDCRVLLLSRPNVIFPYYYRALGDRWQIQLNPAENKSSIRVFLGNCFDIMACEGLFADVKISDALLDDVASRSDGMFLWARLLVNYLESPALSPHERLNVLQQAKLLEGLRGLYNRILLTMRASNPKQSQVAASIFKYVSGSVYPLSPTELHIALAIEPGRRTDDLYLLSNFPQCVRKITCALVDVNTDEGFNFIHLSLKEYLETDPECNVMFSLRDPADLHHFLAVRCLTHLLYDIPELPLRGLQREISLETHAVNMVSCGTEARLEHTLTPSESRTFIQKKFPFIKYAALCWLYHLLRFLSAQSASEIVLRDNRASVDDGKPSVRGDGYGVESHHRRRKRKRLAMDDDGSSGEEDSEYRTANAEALGCRRCLPVKPSAGEAPRSRAVGWITLLAQFLVRRLTVTTWVEASWSFGFRPLLTDLVPLVEDLCTSYSIDSLEGREIWWIHTGVRQLAAALEYLYRKYGPMMEANPTLIWQEHIKEMVDPNFWPCTQTTWSDRLEPFRGEGEVQQGFRPSRDIPPSVSIDHSLMHVS